MKQTKWFIVVIEDKHLNVPYIATENNCGKAITFDSYKEADDYANIHFLNYHICIYEES